MKSSEQKLAKFKAKLENLSSTKLVGILLPLNLKWQSLYSLFYEES